MSLVSRLNNLIPVVVQPNRVTYQNQLTDLRVIGNEIAVYPADGGERYINQGYRRNDAIYSIVSTNAAECSQVRLYHVKIKREEVKTAQEYLELKKGSLNEKVIKELSRMRKSMMENFIIDSKLSKLLNKPNRYQTQSEWIEDIIGLRELQGEGNIWLNIPEGAKAPIELMNIPKSQLNLIGNGRDPWNVVKYEFVLSGNSYRWEPDRLVMWKYANPSPVDALTLEHLRGMAPLQAAIMLTQAMNEADLRVATSNKNGGASGMAYRVDAKSELTDEQRIRMNQSFNNAVNSNEMAGKIALQAGNWGYFNFAQSVKDQQLLEQYGIGFKRLCRVFKTPSQIFDEGNGTWDNQKQAYRRWVYSKIGPLIHGLTGKLNDALLLKFDLDPDRHIIDADLLSLPSMATDLKEQVESVKEAWWLTPNQKLSAMGYEESEDPNMGKVYAPSGVSPLDQLNMPIGGSLDNDVNLLGE